MAVNTTPLEDDECFVLADYLDTLKKQKKISVYTHTANETFTKSWKQKRRNKMMGVRPGIPDYVIVTDKNVLFIEMKRVKGGQVSGYQRKWISVLEGKTAKSVVCRGFDEAKKYIDVYAT